MPHFDIVIAHRGNPLGLWSTIESCEIDLAGKGYDYKYLICSNGEEKLNPDAVNVIHYLKEQDKLGYYEHSVEPLSPPTARERAIKHGDGEYIFIFDNHCILKPGYFDRALLDFKMYPDMDVLHSTTVFYTGQHPQYEYKLTLEKNFWAGSVDEPKDARRPYKIAAGGHGGFVARRAAWEDVGGYWDGFVGYGGEELYLDLKMWMIGYNVYLDPKLVHHHFAGNRGYPRHYSDDYFRNMMMCANIIGGEEWMYRVYEVFAKASKHDSGKTMYDLLMEAHLKSREHAEWVRSVSSKTLDTQLRWFKDNEIPH